MSQPDIEISRRCVVCGASTRSTASFCPQCGVPLPRQETKDLVEAVAEGIKEKKHALNNNETSTEKAATQPLSAFASQMLAQEQGHTAASSSPKIEENSKQAQEQTQVKETSIAAEDEGYWPMPEKDESFSKGETAPLTMVENIKGVTAPLKNIEEPKGATAPLTEIIEPKDSQKALKEIKATQVEQKVLDHPLAVEESEKAKLSAKEKSQILVENTKHPHSQLKKAIVRSQEVLDKASPDPSLRFAIISIVLFIFFLLAFFLNRYLK